MRAGPGPATLMTIAMAAALQARSAHSPLILRNTTDVDAASATTAQAHTNKVLFLDSPLPETVKYEVIGTIDAGRIWYGGDESLFEQMADKAREIGADAVIEVATWKQPSGFSWAAPHGRGKAVKILNKDAANLTKLGGQWR